MGQLNRKQRRSEEDEAMWFGWKESSLHERGHHNSIRSIVKFEIVRETSEPRRRTKRDSWSLWTTEGSRRARLGWSTMKGALPCCGAKAKRAILAMTLPYAAQRTLEPGDGSCDGVRRALETGEGADSFRQTSRGATTVDCESIRAAYITHDDPNHPLDRFSPSSLGAGAPSPLDSTCPLPIHGAP